MEAPKAPVRPGKIYPADKKGRLALLEEGEVFEWFDQDYITINITKISEAEASEITAKTKANQGKTTSKNTKSLCKCCNGKLIQESSTSENGGNREKTILLCNKCCLREETITDYPDYR